MPLVWILDHGTWVTPIVLIALFAGFWIWDDQKKKTGNRQ